MIHEQTARLPEYYRDAVGLLAVAHEEDALTWLWAFPSLFPWETPLEWLYTPVVGNAHWPGDLWGLDRLGNLLVIECKQCRRANDPFADFVAFHRKGLTELQANHWKEKFSRHLAAELGFPSVLSARPAGKTDGIVPRSNKRAHIRRWPALCTRIDKRIRSPDYPERVMDYLRTRSAAGSPTSYYVALMVVSNADRPVLRPAGSASRAKLCGRVGPDHVLVVSIRAEVVTSARLRITTETV